MADWIIDLGPEGGDAGGWVVATGTPEQVAKNPDSFIGHFQAGILPRDAAQRNGRLAEAIS